MAKKQNFEKVELTTIVKSLKGSFQGPKNFDYRNKLAKSLAKKYLTRVERRLI